METIKEKVIKLRATGESLKKAGDIKAAEAFLRKAKELIEKHGIDITQLAQDEAFDAIREFEAKVKRSKGGTYWTITLAHTIAQYYDCTSIRCDSAAQVFKFVGEELNAELATYIFDVAAIVFVNAAKKHYKAHHEAAKAEGLKAFGRRMTAKQLFDVGLLQSDSRFIHAFLCSAASAFAAEFRNAKEKASTVKSTEITKTTDALVKSYIAKHFNVTTGTSSARHSSAAGRTSGKEFGKNYKPAIGVKGGPSTSNNYKSLE